MTSDHKRFHYAWIIVGITFLVLLVAAGVRTAPQVLIKPLEQEYHWSRSSISFAVASKHTLVRSRRAARGHAGRSDSDCGAR